MDIWLLRSKEWTHIRPASVHGMLWLQTHFENSHWEAISSNKVKLSNDEALNLTQDDKADGLNLNCVPTFLNGKKL